MGSKVWNLAWDSKMSVGIPEVDEDHLRCLTLLNGLNHAIVERMDADEIRLQLRLVLYDAELHFANEDELFRRWRYPDTEIHAALHQHLLEDCRQLLAGAAGPNVKREWVSAALAVKDLLVEHLLVDDLKYHDYFVTHSWKGQ